MPSSERRNSSEVRFQVPVARRLADVRTYVRLLARPDDFPDAIDAVDARDARARTENYS